MRSPTVRAAAPPRLTLTELARLEPGLADLERAVRAAAARRLSGRTLARLWFSQFKPRLTKLVGWVRDVPGFAPRPVGRELAPCVRLASGTDAEAEWRRRRAHLAAWMEGLTPERREAEKLLRSMQAYDAVLRPLADLLGV